MATIEERAKKYAPGPLNLNYAMEAYIANELRQAYIAGASEQKVIDDANLHERFEKILKGQKWDFIEKACEWLKENARNYAYATDRCYTVADVCDIHKELVEDFRKAMEE